MARDDESWIPDAIDLDWIESLGAAAARRSRPSRPPPSRSASRSSTATAGRVLRVLAGGRRRIVEVGTAYGYSTLWMALGQPADGTIVTIDPDRERTDLARGWWRQAGIADERITVVNAPGARRVRAPASRRSPGRSTSPSSTRSSPSTSATSRRSPAVSRPGALVLADNVLWSGRVSGARPAAADDANTAALRAFDAAVLGRPAVQRDDPAGRRRPAHRLVARLTAPPACDPSGSGCSPSSASWPGRARCPSSSPDGADVEAAWDGARRRASRSWRPGARRSGSRATATTPTPTTPLADGDEVAMIPPVSAGGRRAAIGSSSCASAVRGRDPGRARRPRWPRPRTARSSGSSAGRVDARDAGAGPGGRGRAPRRADASSRSSTRRTNDGARGPRRRSPTRSRRASGSTGWRSSIGPATCRSARRRSRSSRSRRTGTRPSTRPATRSTRPRRGHRSGRPSASPTATCGSATRREPDRRRSAMKVYISVDMEGIAGVNHPHPTEMATRAIRRRWSS